jgi:Cu(I)/Ag(I) efflux system membrane fusion protein
MTTTNDNNKSSDVDTSPEATNQGKSYRPGRMHRAMAILRWVLLALVTVVAAYTVWTYWGPGASSHSSHRADRYYCPMHPQIRSPDPGECPICHMNLEPIPEDRQAGGAASAPAPDMATGRPNAPSDVVPVTLTAEKQQIIGITTMPATRGALGQELRVPGSVEAPESGLAQVRTRAAGFIERVAVRETGVRVTRGQPLAWIYSPEIYRAQEEFLAASRWASGSGTSSGAQGSSSNEMAGAARRALELLGLTDADIDEVSRSGTSMRAIPVRAPISGHVTRFNAVLGLHASPDTTLYEIADLTRVWVIASVRERDLPNVRAGMTARFASSSQPNNGVVARVDLVEPEVSETTRTARVRLTIQNSKFELRPGQYGDVTFELPESTALLVPRDAVIHTGEHAYVFVDVGSGRFEPRTVRVGTQAGERVQILDGLSEGDRVVSRGSFMLDSESRLQASLAAAPSPPSQGGSGSSEQGPSCEDAFDRQRYSDKFNQCRLCERQHAGMGNMVADCKNAIPRPWR